MKGEWKLTKNFYGEYYKGKGHMVEGYLSFCIERRSTILCGQINGHKCYQAELHWCERRYK